MDLAVGVLVLTVPTEGVDTVEAGVDGVGWVSILTFYLLLAFMVLLLLSGTFVLGPGNFLTMGWCLVGLVLAGFDAHRFVAAEFVVVGFVATGFRVGA